MVGVGKASAMYTTIQRQPADVSRVLKDGWGDAEWAGERLSKCRRVYVVGIGTSYHAALAGSWMLRYMDVDARAVSSFDFAQYPGSYPLTEEDAVIVLSHSGAKQYSLASLEVARNAGAAVLSVGGIDAEHPGSERVLRTTPKEQSAAFTSSHLTAMTVLAQVAAAIGGRFGHASANDLRNAIDELPVKVEETLATEQSIEPLAQIAVDRQSYVVGGGPSEVSALEAVVKGREAAYARVDGMGLEQFIHGPMIGLEPKDVVVLVNVPGGSSTRNEDAVRLFSELGVVLWTVGGAIGQHPNVAVPSTLEVLSPILTTIPMQFWAWHMATLRGIDPDTFRRQEPRFEAGISSIQF